MNQREHSCRYPFDWQTAEPTSGLLDRIRIIAQPLWESTWIVFESASLNNSYGHLGASCSNIGRIRTKENIAVDTHFDRQRQLHWGLYDRIRILAQPLWNGLLIVSESEASKSFILSLVKFIAATIT